MLKFVSTCTFSLAVGAAPALAAQVQEPAVGGEAGDAPRIVTGACGTRIGTATGNSILSDTYAEADGMDAFDAAGAADFTVQQACTIVEVDVQGRYFNFGGPATSVDVVFYDNDPATNVPAGVLRGFVHAPFTDIGGKGSFRISIPPTRFRPGTYWVSVTAHIDVNVEGLWGWDLQQEKQGLPATIKQNGGYGPQCIDFGSLLQCFGARGDYMFMLQGTGQ